MGYPLHRGGHGKLAAGQEGADGAQVGYNRSTGSNAWCSVDLKGESIRNSPEFDPGEPVNRDYEERLYDYYGRLKYWEEPQ
jgi:hypothetical protein